MGGDDDDGCVGWGRWAREGWVVSLCPDLRECLLLKALLVLHCKLALYYVQQSWAVSQLSVQTSLSRGMCYLHVLKAMGCARHTWPLSGLLGTSFSVTVIFLPTPPRKPLSESYSSSIELWMTNSVSLGTNPDVFDRSVRLVLFIPLIFRPSS
jgi:hypothetical protein